MFLFGQTRLFTSLVQLDKLAALSALLTTALALGLSHVSGGSHRLSPIVGRSPNDIKDRCELVQLR